MPPGGIRSNAKRTPVEIEDASGDADLTRQVSPMPVENLTNRFGNNGSNIRGGGDSSDDTSGGSSGGGATKNNNEWDGGPPGPGRDRAAGRHPAETTQDLQMEAQMEAMRIQMAAISKLLAQYQEGTNIEDAEMDKTDTTARKSRRHPDDQDGHENTVGPRRATSETEDAGERPGVPSEPG